MIPLPSWLMNKNAILCILFIAYTFALYYTGFSDGKEKQRLAALSSQSAKLMAFVSEQKSIYDALNEFKGEVLTDAKTSDRPASAYLKRHIDKLPLPPKPPRKP